MRAMVATSLREAGAGGVLVLGHAQRAWQAASGAWLAVTCTSRVSACWGTSMWRWRAGGQLRMLALLFVCFASACERLFFLWCLLYERFNTDISKKNS